MPEISKTKFNTFLSQNRDFVLFMAASLFLGIAQSVDSAVLNNYLNDVFQISVYQRTMLEIPRELPGFLVVFVSGLLFVFGDIRIAAIANMVAAVGMVGLGFISPGFGILVIWLMIYSMGQHLFMPLSNSIGMNLASEGNLGKRLGQINGINTAAFLAGSLVLAVWFHFFGVNYQWSYAIGSAALFITGVLIILMTGHSQHKKSARFVFRKEYGLYYWLCILFGARKQIFITFGPWVLIKVFGQGASTFAILGFITAAIGMFFKPLLGRLIDTVGEKKILAGEATLLILVCGIYALSERFFGAAGLPWLAVIVVCACYVADQLLSSVSMARATYLKKIALRPEDVSPTLSFGVSIDHVISMSIPWIGGMLWDKIGYEWVFVGGAAIALINLISTRRIKLDA